MKIGIDCRTILNPERGEPIGVGHYVYQLVKHLLKIDQKNEYVLFFDQRIKRKKIKKFIQKNAKIVFYPFFLYSKFVPTYFSHYLFDAILQKEKVDVFHFPFIPSPPKKLSIKTIATIHDLSILRLPNLYSKKEIEKEKTKLSFILPFIQKIITVSYSTKRDIEQIFKIPSEKIKVIYHGIDERFFKSSQPGEIEEVKKKYKIGGDYILFLSTLELRKNLCRIFSSFELFKEEIKKNPEKFSQFKDFKLVLAGKPGSALKKVKNKIKKSSYKKDIILTSYLLADDLNHLFAGAKVFLFPSLYEGFGLSVVEAMAKKIPIITSNLSSLPEVVGEGNAIFVNPYQVKEITQALIDLLTDEKKQKELAEKGFLKAKEYCWKKTAEETLKTYQELIS